MCRQHPLLTSPVTYLQVPALRLSIADCSDTAHDIDETIIIISLSSQNKLSRSSLLAPQMIQKVSNTFLSFLHSHRQIAHDTSIWGKLTVEANSPIANSPSAELDTPLVNEAATLPSTAELAIAYSTQDVANGLLKGGFINSFIKNSYIINLKSDQFVCWQSRPHAFPRTQRGLIPKCCLNLKSPFLRFAYIPSTSTLLFTS